MPFFFSAGKKKKSSEPSSKTSTTCLPLAKARTTHPPTYSTLHSKGSSKNNINPRRDDDRPASVTIAPASSDPLKRFNSDGGNRSTNTNTAMPSPSLSSSNLLPLPGLGGAQRSSIHYGSPSCQGKPPLPEYEKNGRAMPPLQRHSSAASETSSANARRSSNSPPTSVNTVPFLQGLASSAIASSSAKEVEGCAALPAIGPVQLSMPTDDVAWDASDFSDARRSLSKSSMPGSAPAILSTFSLSRISQRSLDPPSKGSCSQVTGTAVATHRASTSPHTSMTERELGSSSEARQPAETASPAIFAPQPPQPPQPLDAEAAVFTAMESMSRRRGSSFRLLKRRKSTTEDNATSEKSNVLFLQDTASGDDEKQWEPVSETAMIAQNTSDNIACSSTAASPLIMVPTTTVPPGATKSEPLFRGFTSSSRPNSRRANGFSEMDAALFAANASRRLASGSFRVTTPRDSAARTGVSNNSFCASSLSLDDAPRPLTRHASTLSTGQQEALRRTPSFLSRTHTPPPCVLRDAAQARRGRRILQGRCDSPDAPPATVPTSQEAATISDSSTEQQASSDGKERQSASFTRGDRQLLSPSLHSSEGMGTPRKPRGSGSKDSSMTFAHVNFGVSPQRSPRSDPHTVVQRIVEGESSAQDASTMKMEGEHSKAAPQHMQIPTPPLARYHLPSEAHSLASLPDLPPSTSVAASITPSLSSLDGQAPAAKAKLVTTTPAADCTTSVPAISSAPSSSQRQSMSVSSFTEVRGTLDLDNSRLMLPPPELSTPGQRSSQTATALASGQVSTSMPQDSDATQRPSSRQTLQRLVQMKPVLSKQAGNTNTEPLSKSSDDGNCNVLESLVPEVDQVNDAAQMSTTSVEGVSAKGLSGTSLAAGGLPVAAPTQSQTVRPVNRHRMVAVYVEDDDDLFDVAHTDAVSKGPGRGPRGTLATVNTSHASASPNKADDDLTPALSTASTSPTSNDKSPADEANAAASIVKSVARASRSAPSAQLEFSSDDESDAEEDEEGENLLEGFHPPGFDARRGARQQSSILFYLSKGDSLSSLDLLVRAGRGAGKSQGNPSSSIVSKGTTPPQSEYSLLKLEPALTKPIGARPRVTFDPYIADEFRPLGFSPASASVFSRQDVPTADVKNSSLSISNMDPYGMAIDINRSSTTVPQYLTKNDTDSTDIAALPPSIYIGSTTRFAPDPSKMHRPVANTFGYTAAQLRARKEAAAKGVSAEEWARAGGLDECDDDDDDEDGGAFHDEIYMDENGDEWYWEEIEDEDGEEEEEDEVEEGE